MLSGIAKEDRNSRSLGSLTSHDGGTCPESISEPAVKRLENFKLSKIRPDPRGDSAAFLNDSRLYASKTCLLSSLDQTRVPIRWSPRRPSQALHEESIMRLELDQDGVA
jgi:hypothetical protein